MEVEGDPGEIKALTKELNDLASVSAKHIAL